VLDAMRGNKGAADGIRQTGKEPHRSQLLEGTVLPFGRVLGNKPS